MMMGTEERGELRNGAATSKKKFFLAFVEQEIKLECGFFGGFSVKKGGVPS